MGYLSPIDSLINDLSRYDLQRAAEEVYIGERDAPRDATLRLELEKSPQPVFLGAQFLRLGAGEIVMQASTDQPRGQQFDARVHWFKTAEGETLLDVNAVVTKTQRQPSGYEFAGRLRTVFRSFCPATRVFAQYAAYDDAAGWNRWCAPLEEGVRLRGLNLRGADLSQFDLCCAVIEDCDLSNCNLTNANLSGANLSGAKLDGATVDGADFFGAILPRRYEYLPAASGLLERNSVKFV